MKPKKSVSLILSTLALGYTFDLLPRLSAAETLGVWETKTASGLAQAAPEVAPSDPTLSGSKVYFAKLPVGIRQHVTYINLIISVTPDTTPDSGSVIDIDGAELGFCRMGAQAQVMTKGIGPDGHTAWIPLGIMLPMDFGSGLTVASKLSVCLDNSNLVWSLYYNNALIQSGLKLYTKHRFPRLSVRGGTTLSQEFKLQQINIGTQLL